MSQSSIETLSEFIDTAIRNRQYPPNTAAGLRSALRLFGNELNEVEQASVEQFSNNFDSVYRQVVTRNQQNMTAVSLETYRRRMKNLLGDYENYGTDPTRMVAWNRPTRKVRTKASEATLPRTPPDSPVVSDAPPQDLPETSRLEVALRPAVKAVLLLPADLNAEDAAALKALVDASVRSAR